MTLKNDYQDKLWQKFNSNYHITYNFTKNLLLISLNKNHLKFLSKKIITALLCINNQPKDCFCKSCQWIKIDQHPDIHCINDEKTIKIDSIRQLNTIAYVSPTLSNKSIILIESANNMTNQAANALLKILEEPPNHVHFILTAEHITTIPKTVLSRCQQWRLEDFDLESSYLEKINNSLNNALTLQTEKFLEDLLLLKDDFSLLSSLAQKWSTHSLIDLVKIIYFINAEIIYCQTVGYHNPKKYQFQIQRLAQPFNSFYWFSRLDELNLLVKSLYNNIAINPILTVEKIFTSYLNIR